MVSTHLKNISQIGNLPQVGVKVKKSLKPPPRKFVMFYHVSLSPPRNGFHQIGVTSLHMWYRLRCLPKDFSHKGHVGGSESSKDGDNKGLWKRCENSEELLQAQTSWNPTDLDFLNETFKSFGLQQIEMHTLSSCFWCCCLNWRFLGFLLLWWTLQQMFSYWRVVKECLWIMDDPLNFGRKLSPLQPCIWNTKWAPDPVIHGVMRPL